MPSRYRRPAHVNPVIEYTFKNDLELGRDWRIDYNQTKKVFVFTCKRGTQMEEVIPQNTDPQNRYILRDIIQKHDHMPGHGKAE